MKLHELIETWQEQNGAWHFEMEQGVHNFARLTRALGYRDSMNFGQFQNGCYGDMINFLEDNPGCVEAMVEWIIKQDNEEWRENVESHLNEDSE